MTPISISSCILAQTGSTLCHPSQAQWVDFLSTEAVSEILNGMLFLTSFWCCYRQTLSGFSNSSFYQAVLWEILYKLNLAVNHFLLFWRVWSIVCIYVISILAYIWKMLIIILEKGRCNIIFKWILNNVEFRFMIFRAM